MSLLLRLKEADGDDPGAIQGFFAKFQDVHDLGGLRKKKLALLEAGVEAVMTKYLAKVLAGELGNMSVLLHIADSPHGALAIKKAGGVNNMAKFMTGTEEPMRTQALSLYCCMLHSAAARNVFAQQTIDLGVADVLITNASTTDSIGLLALNWFAGNDTGAHYMIPHLNILLELYKKKNTVSVCLTLVNLPAFLAGDSEAEEKLTKALTLKSLYDRMVNGTVADGQAGIAMGFANLPDLEIDNALGFGPCHPLEYCPTGVLSALVECFASTLLRQPHGNILWVPWQPLQALVGLCQISDDNTHMLFKMKVLPFIVMLLDEDDTDMSPLREPARDKAYAAQLMFEILMYGFKLVDVHTNVYFADFCTQNDVNKFHAVMKKVAEDKRYPMAQYYALAICEMTKNPTVFYPLQHQCRRVLRLQVCETRPHYGFTQEWELPSSLSSFVRYDMPVSGRWIDVHRHMMEMQEKTQEEERRKEM